MSHSDSWCVLALFTFILSSIDPSSSPAFVALTTFGIAVASATQDLPIDAYRITVFREDETQYIGPAAAFATCGWWSGAGIPGVIAFWFVDDLGWSTVYMCYSLVWILLVTLVFFAAKEPLTAADLSPATNCTRGNTRSFLSRAYLESVREFFARNGVVLASAVLGFIFLFKIGEAFLVHWMVVCIACIPTAHNSDHLVGLYSTRTKEGSHETPAFLVNSRAQPYRSRA